jgi:hypothetical protein
MKMPTYMLLVAMEHQKATHDIQEEESAQFPTICPGCGKQNPTGIRKLIDLPSPTRCADCNAILIEEK